MLQSHLETFRINFPLTTVKVYDNDLVYRTKRGCSQRLAVDANELIKELDLPLVAISTSFPAKDSFVVKSNETEL